MNPKKTLPPGDANEEVSALIETLHQTGQRLEELTTGEVDTVTDREGRTFLLGRAQEQLRHTEAAKQAAILNALPAYIALLDAQGRIISVNEAWRRFSSPNMLHGPGQGIGVNYLEICDSARGDDASEAHQVAEGIRSVLVGGVNSFSVEYPCHSPTEQRWFLMTVTPLADDHPNGAVVMHLNITERKRTENALRNSEAELKTAQRVARLGNWYLDLATGAVIWSEEVYRVFDRNPELPPPTYAEHGQLLTVASTERMNAAIENSKQTGAPYEIDLEVLWADDPTKWIAAHGEVVRDDNGQIVGLRGTAQDISERKAQELKIARLSRIQAVLSGINSLIVRVRDRNELFKETCRIAVEVGAFRMAWIGVIDPQTLDGKIVAWHGGEEGYLDKIRLTARDGTPDSERPAGRPAARCGRCNP